MSEQKELARLVMPMTKERERVVRAMAECECSGIDTATIGDLFATLDEARREIERLKREPFRVSSCNVCGTTIFPGDDCPGCQRDEARQDASILWADWANDDWQECPGLADRIVAYRKALDAKKPADR